MLMENIDDIWQTFKKIFNSKSNKYLNNDKHKFDPKSF